jgi:hypothetical protein
LADDGLLRRTESGAARALRKGRRIRMKKSLFCTTALVLVILCSFGTAEDAVFTFRNGITWDSTVAEMMAAEGVREYDANFHQNAITDRFTRYYVQEGAGDAFYVYQSDSPLMMYTNLPRDTKAVPVYTIETEENTARYGAPASFTALDLYALMKVLWPDRLIPEDFGQVTAWQLSDGTLAALFTFRGEPIMAYFHEARITAAAAAAQD